MVMKPIRLLYVFVDLKAHSIQKHSFDFTCIDEQKCCMNLFCNNLPTEIHKKKIPVITTPEKLFYICSTFKVEP